MSHPAPSTPDDRVEPARSFQHYEILRRADGSAWELGRGTMGITYKAFDVNLCCEVALKVVNAALLDAPNARERFVREARAAAALRHRNVASVYHLGNDGERFFYAMEFIDGETLDALVRRKGPLPVEAALLLTEQAARALAAAERQGLVHRDIKPANIMVVHEDADDHMVVKVIDFGLARPAAGKGGSSGQLTVNGFVGTPQFASPEQLEEQGLDVRADIYSLGVTLWFLLTGRAPFAGSLATICHQHLTAPPPWDRLPVGLPAPVDRLLAHMLEKDPANRPQNAVELRREIDACLDAVRQSPATRDAGPRRADDTPRPQSGTVIKSRYKVGRPLGEGTRGRMFEGRDTQADGAPVTITFLSAQRLPGPADAERLGDEVRLVQAAAHPQLAQVFAFERAANGREAFLVEEAINGGTLVDLLAARGGPLSTVETLRLIGQAAAAADHAASRRLEHLGLAVHQVCLHFEDADTDGARRHLPTAMKEWPTWALKIDPLATIGESAEVNTWTGDVTLVPGVHPADTGGAGQLSPSALGIAYLHSLAALTYELLGGTPGAWRKAAGPGGQYVSLPALNEEANTVLRLALTGRSGLLRSRHFYEALARAEGFDPVNLQVAPAVGTRALPTLAPPAPPTRRVAPVRREPVPARRSEVVIHDDDEVYLEGSIADRLTLVSDDASPVGRWFLALAALAVVFVLTVAGVWIMLAQRVSHDVPAKRETVRTPTHEAHRRVAVTPRPLVPPPLRKEATPTPTATPIADAAAPLPAPTPPLTPSNPTVIVRVKSIPTGAEISLAGKTLGVTPFEVELPVGTCELVARLDGWPETRETVILNESLSKTVTEIHLMPPGLVPGSEISSPAVPVNHPRRTSALPSRTPPPERRAIPVEPFPDGSLQTPGPTAATRPEPEVRRALPPLTPFDPDATPRGD